MPRAEHPNKSAALRAVADGSPVSDVAKRFDLSTRTLRRWRAADARPAPTLSALEGWSQLRAEAIDELRRQSAAGKTAATKELHRLASVNEATENECAKHLTLDDYARSMQWQSAMWGNRIIKFLTMDLAKKYDLAEGPLAAFIIDWVDATGHQIQRLHDELNI